MSADQNPPALFTNVSLPDTVNQFLKPYITADGPVIFVAVSGGLDSMVLLHIMTTLQKELGLDLRVVHVNHGLRGEESDADEALVADFSRRHNLVLKRKKLSLDDEHPSEEVLRAKRYAFFEECLKGEKRAFMLLAHHLNDQLETFLMRVFKGSYLKGLTGMREQRGPFLRPLLSVPREALDRYAREQGLVWREDASNNDRSYLRNALRHELLPLLKRHFGPDYLHNFQKSFSDIVQAESKLQEKYLPVFRSMIRQEEGRSAVKIEPYLQLDRFESRLFWNYCFSYVYPLSFQVSGTFLQSFGKFLKHAATGRSFSIASRLEILKNREEFFFDDKSGKIPPGVKLYPGHIVAWGRFHLGLSEVADVTPEMNDKGNEEYICGDMLDMPLLVRGWQRGDRFIPLGMKRFKKVSDFFIDRKVDRLTKKEIPLVLSGEKIVWLAGLRLDERFKVTPECTRVYKLEIMKEV